MDTLLRQALERAEEVASQLADPATARDSQRLQALGREHARLAPIQRIAERLERLRDELQQARELTGDGSDPDLAALAAADIERLPGEIAELVDSLQELLLPPDPLEERDAIIEIRAGTGGDEAALFASELFRMYSRFVERHGLKEEIMELHDATLGGIKEVIAAIRGRGA